MPRLSPPAFPFCHPCVGKFSSLGGVRRSREVGCPRPQCGADNPLRWRRGGRERGRGSGKFAPPRHCVTPLRPLWWEKNFLLLRRNTKNAKIP